ncbi:MAG: 3'(2'),5'-bisphosphate nucleotidase CysQ, partial [Pseudomonadota bacterium]
HASRIDGSPLVYNQRDVYLPDLLICRKEHADKVLGLIAGLEPANA